MLVVCGLLLWRKQWVSDNEKTKAVQKNEHRTETESSPAEVFKGELLQLEIDRSLGTITRTQYVSAKQALEETVKRTLARTRIG
jgi:hypothetical protein